MRADAEAGRLGEMLVMDRLASMLVEHEIVWTRTTGRANQPFDIEIYHGGECVCLVEVKAFGAGRKWDWTQFKRPAIKRKKARAQTLNCDRMFTIVVNLETEEMRCSEGFPSQPFDAFGEMGQILA